MQQRYNKRTGQVINVAGDVHIHVHSAPTVSWWRLWAWLNKKELVVKLVVCALMAGLGFSMGSAHAEQLQCRLNGQPSLITLNLQPPKVIHQVAGQAALSVVGKANNQGVLSYTLPNKASYQLNRSTLGYTQVLNNKSLQGQCQVMTSKPKPNYVCGKKFYCKQMQSCEEATYYMNHCGLSKLDSDRDGSPCENVCGD